MMHPGLVDLVGASAGAIDFEYSRDKESSRWWMFWPAQCRPCMNAPDYKHLFTEAVSCLHAGWNYSMLHRGAKHIPASAALARIRAEFWKPTPSSSPRLDRACISRDKTALTGFLIVVMMREVHASEESRPNGVAHGKVYFFR